MIVFAVATQLGGCMTIHHQPIVLNIYQVPPNLTDDEQMNDCDQYSEQEMLCDMGLRI